MSRKGKGPNKHQITNLEFDRYGGEVMARMCPRDRMPVNPLALASIPSPSLLDSRPRDGSPP